MTFDIDMSTSRPPMCGHGHSSRMKVKVMDHIKGQCNSVCAKRVFTAESYEYSLMAVVIGFYTVTSSAAS